MTARKAQSADLSALRINRDGDAERPGPTQRYKAILIVLSTLVLLPLIFYFAFSKDGSAPKVRLGVVTEVYPSQVDAILTASGYVVAQRQAAIASKGTGRLEFLGAEEGDAVKKGQIIAQLEHNDVDAALEQARANLQMAKATLRQNEADLHEAQLNYERQQNLLEKGLISGSEYDIAEARFRSAEAAVAAAQAQIKLAEARVVSAQVDVENTNIRAPFDGTVLTKNADIGEMVAPFAASVNSRGAVVTIADMASLEVEADVSEANIQRVRQGQACEIILDAFPDVRYPGFVHKIVPTADRAKATVLTKIRFKERDAKVLPEMSAKVNFLSTTMQDNGASNAPFQAVPKSAIARRNDRFVVLVVRDRTVTETPISVGKEFGELVEVLDGVSNGDKVVLNPTDDLVSGHKVIIESN